MHLLSRFNKDFQRAVRKERYDHVDGGVVIGGSVRLIGTYREGIRGLPESFRTHKNLIPDAGILHILNVVLGATAKLSAWYIAPFSGSTAAAANDTAANFTSVHSEIVSGSEGYTQANRVLWVPAAAASGLIINTASLAAFTIITASQLNILGAGMLSAQAKGATTGTLISVVKYGATRVLNSGDTWDAEYGVSLTDS